MNNGKHYAIYLTFNEIEKVMKILPHIKYQVEKIETSRRMSAYHIEYIKKNAKRIAEYQKKYRKRRAKENQKLYGKKSKIKKTKGRVKHGTKRNKK